MDTPIVPKKLPITVAMVLFNNEAIVEKSLKTFADLADEIVIIHDGPCADRTLEIARRYTDRVYVRSHAGSAEAHRIEALELASNDWVLQLDADERLSDELRAALPALIEHPQADIYDLAFHWYLDGVWEQGMYRNVLFRKSRISLIGSIHEYIRPLDASVKTLRVEAPLLHEQELGRFTAHGKVKRKKWSKIHADNLVAGVGRVSKWNYQGTTWHRADELRLRHPVLLGMLATPAFHVFKAFRALIAKRSRFLFRSALMAAGYNYVVYAQVAALRLGLKP